MSAQDRTEQVLREFHILFSQSEVYDKATNRVIVDKKEALQILQRLNICIYDLMEEYELTGQKRAAAEREIRRKSAGIVSDANRMAEDVYAGAVIYTDEALRRIQDIIQNSADSLKQLCEKMDADIQKEKSNIHRDQFELKSYLEDLHDTNKYLKLIEECNKQIEKERVKEKEETPVYAVAKPEIKVNTEYFEKKGFVLPEDIPEEKAEKTETAEVRVNLDAEYFKWKEETTETETKEKKSERSSFLGKFLKGEK